MDVDKAKRLQRIRLVMALDDIALSLSAADFLWNIDADESCSLVELRRYRCYEQACVISYGRLFADSRGLPKFSLKMVGIKPTEDQSALHDQLIAMRNKVIAHSDAERVRVRASSFPVSLGDEAGRDVHFPNIQFDEGLTWLDTGALPLVKWLRIIRSATQTKIFKELQENPDAFNFYVDYKNPDASQL